jgi:hypothetical protein
VNDTAISTSLATNPLAVDEGTKPSFPLLLGIFVVHVVLWIGLIRLVPGNDRVSFEFLGSVTMPWFRQFVIPLLVVLMFQLVVINRLGWTRTVLTEPSRSTRQWLWAFPAAIISLALTVFLAAGLSDASGSYFVGMTITMLLVGITEELTFRGIMQVGARRLLSREWQAVVFSSALFGLFHLPNILVGAPTGPTIGQVFQTALLGTAIYCVRRVSGSLIPCIVLHAVYDWLVIQGKAHTLVDSIP